MLSHTYNPSSNASTSAQDRSDFAALFSFGDRSRVALDTPAEIPAPLDYSMLYARQFSPGWAPTDRAQFSEQQRSTQAGRFFNQGPIAQAPSTAVPEQAHSAYGHLAPATAVGAWPPMPTMPGPSAFTNAAQLQTGPGTTAIRPVVAQIEPTKGCLPRQCRHCGTFGKVKDGKIVEKWRPSAAGPGTLCDKCGIRLKRSTTPSHSQISFSFSSLPNLGGGDSHGLSPGAPTIAWQHQRHNRSQSISAPTSGSAHLDPVRPDIMARSPDHAVYPSASAGRCLSHSMLATQGTFLDEEPMRVSQRQPDLSQMFIGLDIPGISVAEPPAAPDTPGSFAGPWQPPSPFSSTSSWDPWGPLSIPASPGSPGGSFWGSSAASSPVPSSPEHCPSAGQYLSAHDGGAATMGEVPRTAAVSPLGMEALSQPQPGYLLPADAMLSGPEAFAPHARQADGAFPDFGPEGMFAMGMDVLKPEVGSQRTKETSACRRRTVARYVCPLPLCRDTFTKRHNLNGHVLAHNDDRQKLCQWCSRPFVRANDCRRHERKYCKRRQPIESAEGCSDGNTPMAVLYSGAT